MSSKGKKRLIIAACVVGVLAILCLWVVPKLVDLNRYRPQVEALLEKETGKPAHIGHLQLTVFPYLSVQVDNFVLGNPPGFPAGDFVNTRRIYARVDAGALWDRKIVINSLVIEAPVIHLLSSPDGHWNFENPPTPATAAARPSESGKSSFSLGEISKIDLDGGVVTTANLLPSRQAGPTYFEARGISCDFKNVNVAAAAAAAAPSASLNRPHPSLLAGLLSPVMVYAEQPHPQQAQPIAQGSFKADSLRFGAIQATAVNSQVWVFPKQAYLDKVNFKLAGGSAQGKAEFDYSGQNPHFKIRTVFENIDVAQLSQAFPSAQGKMTGTMKGDLNVEGDASHSKDPLSGLVGTGQVIVRNGRMPTLQLNRNLLTLARFAGLGASSGDPAAFSLISTDLNLAKEVLTSHNIKVVSNDVDVDGSGTLALAGEGNLNYTGVAKLAAKQTGLTNLVAGISGATYSNGKLAFPFDLAGTLANPKFSLKSGKGLLGGFSKGSSATGSQGSSPSNLIQGLTKLFGKKKTTTKPQP